MGRSVSTHRDAVATVFLHLEFEDDADAQYEWESFVEDLRDNVLLSKYPSLSECDRWSGREDHIIAENRHCEVSVSEYCGCVAICLAPRDIDNAFSVAWCERLAPSFERYVESMFKSSAMRKLGTMSNGESVFRKIDNDND